MRDMPFDEYMIERFRANPAYAADLLNDIFEDGDDQGELQGIFELLTAAGLKVSPVSVTPKAKPRAARARVGAATKTSRGQKTAKTAKSAPRRSRVRTSAAAAIA